MSGDGKDACEYGNEMERNENGGSYVDINENNNDGLYKFYLEQPTTNLLEHE